MRMRVSSSGVLGGGGTSLPYFLEARVVGPVYMENEYARIVAEEGIPGLALWVGFLAWALSRRIARRREESWPVGRQLAWFTDAAFFASGVLGMGLFSAIPGAALMLLFIGWLLFRRKALSV